MIKELVLSTAALLASTGAAVSAPWEGPRKSEDEMRRLETPSDIKKTPKIPTYKALAMFGLHLGYLDLLEEKRSELALTANPAHSLASNRVAIGIAAMDGVHNGFTSSRNDALFAVSIGVDLFNWLSRDRSSEQVAEALKRDLDNLKAPSLWLVRVSQIELPAADTDRLDQELRSEFLNLESDLLALPLKCDHVYYRATNPFGSRGVWGRYVSGLWQSRMYICGHDDPDLSFAIANKEIASISVQTTAEGQLVSRMFFHKLDRNTGIKNILSIPESEQKLVARGLFERLRPSIGNRWKVVYTAPNKTGDWKVFVASNGIEAEFDLPEIRRR